MNKKFNNKYRISSARLVNYDYSDNGMYFITICTKNRVDFFGKIINGQMILSEIGEIVSEEWVKSEKIRKHIFIDEWVVMPNHIHGIIVIDHGNHIRRDVLTKRLYEYDGKHPKMSKISPISYSLSTMIRFFKRSVTIKAKIINPEFAWQTRFHDHIIRNEKSLIRIRKYIFENPKIWFRDRNNFTKIDNE